MKLYAISDLHVGHPDNRSALGEIPAQPDDWLILGGDICETVEDLEFVISVLDQKFARLVWVPGNHELWTIPRRETLRGEDKYQCLVETCRKYGVLTPEDPYVVWPGAGGPHLIAPLFLLYDYSFGPDALAPSEAVEWARQSGIQCVDEYLLHPDPHATREAWCEQRCRVTKQRLDEAMSVHGLPTVLINHFPLRRELAVLPRVPRFVVWCGTRRTQDWHTRYRASVVIYGHLHIRQCQWIDGVRFEEVSLGYSGQWARERGVEAYIRQVLPAPP